MNLRILLMSLAMGSPALAQEGHAGHDMSAMGHDMPGMTHDMSTMDHDMSSMTPSDTATTPPPPPTDHAAERIYSPAAMAAARAVLAGEHGGASVWKVMLNTAEARLHDGRDGYAWRGEVWIGGDINRFVVKSEGEGVQGEGAESAEVQALYSRAISPYFDVQAGLRQDFKPHPSRTYASVGLEGLAPYGWEASAAAFLSDHGDLSARLEGSYDFRLTQNLILQPRAEINLAASNVDELGVGSGMSDAELGLRLRYHLAREFAPYVGVVHLRKFGRTADLARAAAEDPSETSLVLGVRAWF